MKIFLSIILLTLCGTLKSVAQGMSEAEIRQHLGKSKYTPVSRDLAQRQAVDTAVCFVTYQYIYHVGQPDANLEKHSRSKSGI